VEILDAEVIDDKGELGLPRGMLEARDVRELWVALLGA
jgi:hypothetical protein